MKLEDLIGNTPIIELESIPVNKKVRIYCKLEGQNPGGSVKDRAALGMIDGALKRGDIKPGDKLVEATSGNTGIALAMIAAMKGIDITLIMPEGATEERKKSMRAFGAKLILTPAEKTIEYSRTLAEKWLMKTAILCLISSETQIIIKCTKKQPARKFGGIPTAKSLILFRRWELQARLWAYQGI